VPIPRLRATETAPLVCQAVEENEAVRAMVLVVSPRKTSGFLCGSCYHSSMHPERKSRRQFTPVWRAVIEIAFIVFLFYSNLLMGEFTVSNGPGKSLGFALSDIFTRTNFLIAVISALIGNAVFEYLRKKL
jgi:hypothetical protein